MGQCERKEQYKCAIPWFASRIGNEIERAVRQHQRHRMTNRPSVWWRPKKKNWKRRNHFLINYSAVTCDTMSNRNDDNLFFAFCICPAAKISASVWHFVQWGLWTRTLMGDTRSPLVMNIVAFEATAATKIRIWFYLIWPPFGHSSIPSTSSSSSSFFWASISRSNALAPTSIYNRDIVQTMIKMNEIEAS